MEWLRRLNGGFGWADAQLFLWIVVLPVAIAIVVLVEYPACWHWVGFLDAQGWSRWVWNGLGASLLGTLALVRLGLAVQRRREKRRCRGLDGRIEKEEEKKTV